MNNPENNIKNNIINNTNIINNEKTNNNINNNVNNKNKFNIYHGSTEPATIGKFDEFFKTEYIYKLVKTGKKIVIRYEKKTRH